MGIEAKGVLMVIFNTVYGMEALVQWKLFARCLP
jgi:hypothetical protein